MKTPISTETKLTKDVEGESVDNTKYRGMIGSLLYLTASRPDIMFSVCLCARFQEDPKTSHLEAVKRIFRYVKGTMHLGLWYPKGSGIETIVYADSDHARDYVDQKSTSGICTFMGCCLTSWFSKKQTALAISTTEAEYVSAGKACQQALWMKQALVDYGIRHTLGEGCSGGNGKGLTKKYYIDHLATRHFKTNDLKVSYKTRVASDFSLFSALDSTLHQAGMWRCDEVAIHSIPVPPQPDSSVMDGADAEYVGTTTESVVAGGASRVPLPGVEAICFDINLLSRDYKTEYKKVKVKLALLMVGPSSTQPAKPFQSKIKVLMALADDEELAVGKNHAKNGKWIDITMRKVNILLSIDKDADWKTYLKNINIDIKRGVFAKPSQSSDSTLGLRYNTCGSTVHSTTNHADFDHFKRGEKLQAVKAKEPTKKWVHERTNSVYYLCRDTSGSCLVPGQWMLKEYD
ncbi:hypothetical protein Tco_1410661 [Tanacetum coccineum]